MTKIIRYFANVHETILKITRKRLGFSFKVVFFNPLYINLSPAFFFSPFSLSLSLDVLAPYVGISKRDGGEDSRGCFSPPFE